MNKFNLSLTMGALLLGLALSSPAMAEGDAAEGAKVYNKCKACHTLEEGKHKVGPSLHGFFGRAAGVVEGFKYSEAMKNSGITWDDETTAAYLKDPKGYIKGNRMAFVGLKKDADIDNLMAYLKENTK